MDFFSEELRHYYIPKLPWYSVTQCLETSKHEIIIALFLPFDWTVSCLSIKEPHYFPGACHHCFKQVEYCPRQNLQLLTCTNGPQHSPEWGWHTKREVHNSLPDTMIHFLSLSSDWCYEKCPQSYAHSRKRFLTKEDIFNSFHLEKAHWVWEWKVTELAKVRRSTLAWRLSCSLREKIQMTKSLQRGFIKRSLEMW